MNYFRILLVLLLFSACKKKEDEKKTAEEPAPLTQPKQVKVNISGTEFACDYCVNTYFSGGIHGVNVSESAGSNRFVFNFNDSLSPGTFSIKREGFPSFTYEKNGFYYRGQGEVSITAVETGTGGSLNLLKGSFSCTTDTANDGTFFNFKQGELNLDFR